MRISTLAMGRRGSVSSSVSVVNKFQTKVIGAQKRLVCAPN